MYSFPHLEISLPKLAIAFCLFFFEKSCRCACFKVSIAQFHEEGVGSLMPGTPDISCFVCLLFCVSVIGAVSGTEGSIS